VGRQDSYGELKNVVAEAVKHFLEEFQTKTGQVDEARLMAKLETGEAKMNEIANAMLTKVQKSRLACAHNEQFRTS